MSSITDRDKVISLLNDLKIPYEVNDGTIYIDPFYVDGADEAVIKFWDGEDFPDGQFHEFSVVPEHRMGKWLIKRVGDNDHAICSVCGDDSYLSPEWDALELYKYCPNCGSDNREAEG